MNAQKLYGLFSFLIIVTLLCAVGGSNARAEGIQPAGGGGPGEMAPIITYQGQLKNGGVQVTGTCDFNFSLWDQSSAGIQIGSTDSEPSVAVANGLFSVTLNVSKQFGSAAFSGNMRWLQIEVRCPAGSGAYTTLSPRQWISAAPYAAGIVPGTQVTGTAYQVLKVMSNAPTGSIPASVTGEILTATDGAGVYGSNSVTTAGATGMGVWGRSYSPSGTGVKGTGVYGALGVYAEGAGLGLNHPALFAENTSTQAGEPAGVAIYGLNHGGDAAIVGRNSSTGDLFRGISSGSTLVFRVQNDGHVIAPSASLTGGSDLAEQFGVDGAVPEPGTLMVIDAAHPGQLVPSATAYDPKVAGVVSGAGGLQPGLTLAEQAGAPIAIAGRVYVKAEALSGPIRPGDLLTSSALPGCAMKAADRDRAQGAVIGKAMSGLESGTGLVLVLVNLQ